MQEFPTKFEMRHIISSAYNPQSSRRAEWAVKAAKRMVRDSTGHNRTLDINMFLAALTAARLSLGGISRTSCSLRHGSCRSGPSGTSL